MRCLTARVLAALVALAASMVVQGLMSPADATAGCPRVGEDGICLSDEIHPPTPLDPPGRPASASEKTVAGTASGGSGCRDEGKVIPCTKQGFSWMSSPTGGCYGAMLDHAAEDDPAWQGHEPSEGNIAYCPLDGVSQAMFFVPNAAVPQIVDAGCERARDVGPGSL